MCTSQPRYPTTLSQRLPSMRLCENGRVISVSDGANASRPSKQMRNSALLLLAWPFISQPF